MNAKRKPTKPVKAWALIGPAHSDAAEPLLFAALHNCLYPTRQEARADKFSFQRIARVEIREVGR